MFLCEREWFCVEEKRPKKKSWMLLYQKEKGEKKIKSSPLQSRQAIGYRGLSNVVRTELVDG